MLAVGCIAQGSFASLTFGLATLAPAIRSAYDLSLGETGLLLASAPIGVLVALIPWGLATDRAGERLVVTAGLLGAAGALAGASVTSSYAVLFALLALAGGSGASVISGTGRAVMTWFGEDERGLALGIRQTAIPVAGATAAVALPWLSEGWGVELAFVVLAGGCITGAAGAVALRSRVRPSSSATPTVTSSMLRERRLWRLSLGSVLICVAQISLVSFAVLFLHDERELSLTTAGLALAGGQLIAAVLRIALGVWSDHMGNRIILLRRMAIALGASVLASAVLLDAPVQVLFPTLMVAIGLSAGWNSLSFTAAAELGGIEQSGSAIGIQQTALALSAVLVPVGFAATVESTSWTAAFAVAALSPLAGWWILRPLATDKRAPAIQSPGV